jgi:hypothetical protein
MQIFFCICYRIGYNLTAGGMGLLPCVAVARRAPYRTQRGRGVFAIELGDHRISF